MNVLDLIGRTDELFTADMRNNEKHLARIVKSSRFLVLGGGGSIGQSVTKEIFKRNPRVLHVVDQNENAIVELVRDIRSSFGYTDGDFQTFALDVGSLEYDVFFESFESYDYVLNLSALKHVRSEKDPFTLMRMIQVNILNTEKTLLQAVNSGVKKYFCVSTDKAVNPVSMMGASKRIMEMFLLRRSLEIEVSTARFANVAFSDGSLLHGFNQRLEKHQPLVAPSDVRRYFLTPQESGELCLMSCVFGETRDIFFPKLSIDRHLISFADIALRYLTIKGFEPIFCDTEDEARELAGTLPGQGKWPCLFTQSDTSGEKGIEEFFSDEEMLDFERFESIGVIKNSTNFDSQKLAYFESRVNDMRYRLKWDKRELIELFADVVPEFGHKETGKYLDGKM